MLQVVVVIITCLNIQSIDYCGAYIPKRADNTPVTYPTIAACQKDTDNVAEVVIPKLEKASGGKVYYARGLCVPVRRTEA